MHKTVKTVLIICLILAVLGAGCLIAGFALGGQPGFRLDWKNRTITAGDELKARETLTPEAFTTLQIEVATADITVERGDAWALTYALSEEPEITQAGGVLKLEGQEHGSIGVVGFSFGKNNSPFVKVTVPADAALEEITLTTATGDMTLSDLEAGRIELTCATGDMTLSSVTAQTLLLTANTGDLELRNVSAAEQARLTTNTGDIDAELNAPGGVAAEANTGDVSLTLRGDEEDFALSIETDLGDVTVSGRDNGRALDTEGDIPVRAETNTGDVEVWFS